jgi:hypothetical protein
MNLRPTDRLRSLGKTDHVMPDSACLSCGKRLDRATMSNGDHRPSPGNITICAFGCGHIMAFADDLSLRELTDNEIIDVAGDPRLVQLQKICGRIRKKRAKP